MVRLTQAGVPENLLHGRFKANRRARIRHGLNKQERLNKIDIIKRLKKHELSPFQKLAGARRIA